MRGVLLCLPWREVMRGVLFCLDLLRGFILAPEGGWVGGHVPWRWGRGLARGSITYGVPQVQG